MTAQTVGPARRALVGTLALLTSLLGVGVGVGAPAGAVQVGPNDVRISTMGPSGQPGFEAQQQAMAYDPTNDRYLVVWRGDDQADLQAEIYGQLVGARTAAETGPDDFLVARVGPAGEPDTDATDPDVVWNSQRAEFLVVYVGDEALDAPGFVTDTNEVYAQRVSAAGAPVGAPLRVSDLGTDDANGSFDAFEPAVAYSAATDSYVVVWRGDSDENGLVNGENEVFAQRVGYSGGTLVQLGANDVQVSDVGGANGIGAFDARANPDVAWNSVNDEFLVVWDADDLATDNEFEVFGQRLSSTGTEVGTNDVRISATGTDADTTAEAFVGEVTYNAVANEYLVVWQGDGLGPVVNDFEIFGQRLAGGTGAEIGADTRLTTMGAGRPAQFPAVAQDPGTDEYALVWTSEGPGLAADEIEVFGERLNADLTVREATSRLSDMNPDGQVPAGPNTPKVAYSERAVDGYLVTWSGENQPETAAGEGEVWGQLYAAAADLAATITAQPAAPAPGETVTTTFTVTNTGPDRVLDVVLTGTVAAGLTGTTVTATSPGLTLRPGSAFIWDAASLPAGQSLSATVTGTVGATQPNGTVLTSTATVASTTIALDPDPADNSATASVTVDAPPTVTVEQAAGQADPANASPIRFTATFSEPVSGLVGADVTLSGTAGATTATVSGGPTTYDLAVSAMTSDGTVTASLPAGAATDLDADPDGSLASTSTDNTVTYDATPPTVMLTTSVTDPTNAALIPVTIQFSEPVTGLTALELVAGNATLGALTAVDADTYTVDLTPSADGPVTLDLPANVANDAAGNGNVAAARLTVGYDGTPPAVTLTTSATDPTSTAPIPVRVLFSEPVSNFLLTDIVVANGTAGAFTVVSAAEYTVDITPTAQGTVTVDVPAQVATDAAGNDNTAGSLSVGYDTGPPTVALTTSATDPTGSSSIPVRVQFSEPVTGFSGTDLVVGNGTAGPVTTVDAATYDVAITPLVGGAVTVDLPGGAATDLAGNASLAAPRLTVVYDSGRPGVTLTSSVADPTNVATVPLVITFTEPVLGFTTADLVVTGATVTNLVQVGPTVYSADLVPTADGLVTVDLPANAANDLAGNPNTAAPTFTVLVDRTAPVPTMSVTSPTATSTIPVTVQFSEPVNFFDVSDVTVTGGTAGAFAGTGALYTLVVTALGDGTVTVTVAAGAAQDAAGNASAAAGPLTVVVDATAPSVVLSTTAGSPTNVSPIPVRVQFSEPVIGFELPDVTVSGGTAGAFAAVDAATYTLEVTPAGDGPVTVDVAAGAAQDAVGNASTAAAQLAVTYDGTVPSVTVDQASGQADPTSSAPIRFTAVFSEPMTGFTAGDVVVSGPAGAVAAVSPTAPAASYEITVTGMTAPGAVSVTVLAGAALDAAGNASAASTSTDNVVQFVLAAPSITWVRPAGGPTGGGTRVTVSGTGFGPAPTVTIGGVAVAATLTGPDALAFTTPARQTPGAVPVVVANGPASARATFTYFAPRIASVRPARGSPAGGTRVTIIGAGFTGARVLFGGVPGRNLLIVSQTELRVTTPPHRAGRVDVTVELDGADVTRRGGFRYVARAARAGGGAADDGLADTGSDLSAAALGAALLVSGASVRRWSHRLTESMTARDGHGRQGACPSPIARPRLCPRPPAAAPRWPTRSSTVAPPSRSTSGAGTG